VVGAVAVGWALPWLGWTLLGFLVLDAAIAAWRARSGAFRPEPRPDESREVDEEEELLV
jgi:hypothetical protein